MVALMSVIMREVDSGAWILWCTRTSAAVTTLGANMQLHGNKKRKSNLPTSEISPVQLHACAVQCGRYSPDHVQATEAAVIRFGDNAPSAREHFGCTGLPGPPNHGD
jgi:hypothetical protein